MLKERNGMNQEQVLLEKLKEIAEILQKEYTHKEEIGVLSGISGIALFQFYYAKLMNEESHAEIGVELLGLVFQKINEGYTLPTFCSGIAGAAWAIELLQEEEFIDIDCDEVLSGLDTYLIQFIKNTESDQNFYDFLHGILGVGFYFLKRYQNTKSKTLKEKYKGLLLEIVALLQKTSQIEDNRAKWESYLIRDEDVKGYNLSFAHGITSIINFLSRLAAYDDFNKEVVTLLQQSVKYIFSLKNKEGTDSSSFPSWITCDNKKSESSRLAWCYGDLGIGITLWRVGKVLGNTKYKNEAIVILKHAAKRRDLTETSINDAGLCHGAFGVMHMYNYMYTETRDPIFEETAGFWMNVGLNMAVHKKGHAGYMQWVGGEHPGWRTEISVLEGIAGIGLSILSYLAPFDTKWDECLLIG
ncbi:lanthionine synthetase C family protein [Aquimarina algiphila]|uniref:lanthionine synthetase C family protein n=1 Tax=Aquimarina algiphila TaxID=2047982 RepID=UPI002493C6F0|nr:lanthionine synthetase C family protein [Aquimarina algiphila]